LLIDATHGGREKGVWGRIWAWNERKNRIGSRWAESRRALVSDRVRELRITEGAGGGHCSPCAAHTHVHARSQRYSIQPFRVSVWTTRTCVHVWHNNYLEHRASTTFAKCLHPLWSPHQTGLNMLY